MLIINLTLIVLISFLLFITRNYGKEYMQCINTSEHKLKFLYPLSLFLVDKYKEFSGNTFKVKNMEALKMLYINKDAALIAKLYYCEKTAIGIFIMSAFNILSILLTLSTTGTLIDNSYILRPDYGNNYEEYSLNAVIDDDTSLQYEEIIIKVSEKRYNNEEVTLLFSKAKDYIEQSVLGSNTSSEEINDKLNLIKTIPKTGIKISWEPDEYNLIKSNGEINRDNYDGNIPSEGILTNITAKLEYYDYTAEYELWFRVMPMIISDKEKLENELHSLLETVDQSSLTDDKFQLPKEIEGKRINWSEKKTNGSILTLFGIVSAIIIFLLKDEELYRKLSKRDSQMLLDYSEIVNKFNLLISAGMTIKGAWSKITSDYENKVSISIKNKRYAYDEMAKTWNELSIGIPEYKAYDNFGKRTGLHQYLKFSTLIVQNLKKGSKGLVESLELEVIEAFEDRKQFAKRLGEEAGTKLLLPMFLMLLVVLVIIMVPAFMSFGI